MTNLFIFTIKVEQLSCVKKITLTNLLKLSNTEETPKKIWPYNYITLLSSSSF